MDIKKIKKDIGELITDLDSLITDDLDETEVVGKPDMTDENSVGAINSDTLKADNRSDYYTTELEKFESLLENEEDKESEYSSSLKERISEFKDILSSIDKGDENVTSDNLLETEKDTEVEVPEGVVNADGSVVKTKLEKVKVDEAIKQTTESADKEELKLIKRFDSILKDIKSKTDLDLEPASAEIDEENGLINLNVYVHGTDDYEIENLWKTLSPKYEIYADRKGRQDAVLLSDKGYDLYFTFGDEPSLVIAQDDDSIA